MKRMTILIATFTALAAPLTSFAAGQNVPASTAASRSTVKTLTVVYSNAKNIAPNNFSVKTGERIRVEVNPLDTASGCMDTIMIPGLWDKPLPLVKGKKIVMEFTPKRAGSYKITCAMGVPRGVIDVR